MKIRQLIFIFFTFAFAFPAFSKKSEDLSAPNYEAIVSSGTILEIRKISNGKENREKLKQVFGEERKTLLIIALENNRQQEIIEFLLEIGIDPLLKTTKSQTALMLACKFSNPECVNMILITQKKDEAKRKYICETDKDGKTSFDYARENQNEKNKEKILKILNKYSVDLGIDKTKNLKTADIVVHSPNFKSEKKQNEESQNLIEENEKIANEKNLTQEIVENPFSNENPSEISQIQESESKPEVESEPKLQLGSESKSEQKLEPEISAPDPKIDVALSLEEESDSKKTFEVPPQIAIPRSKIKIDEWLFDFSIDLEDERDEIPYDDFNPEERTFIENAEKRDAFGRTPLMIFAQRGDEEKIKDLLYSGANVQSKDYDDWTALMFAVRYQTNPKITEILLEAGSSVTVENKHGLSALKIACAFNQNPTITSMLLKNRSVSEREIRSAFIFAIENESPISILNVFLLKGVPVNFSFEGKTPLMYAAKSNGSTEIISWLLERGAKISLKTAQGKTAFDFAKENKKLPHDLVFWALNGE